MAHTSAQVNQFRIYLHFPKGVGKRHIPFLGSNDYFRTDLPFVNSSRFLLTFVHCSGLRTADFFPFANFECIIWELPTFHGIAFFDGEAFFIILGHLLSTKEFANIDSTPFPRVLIYFDEVSLAFLTKLCQKRLRFFFTSTLIDGNLVARIRALIFQRIFRLSWMNSQSFFTHSPSERNAVPVCCFLGSSFATAILMFCLGYRES